MLHELVPEAVPLAPRSVTQLTWVTPKVSDALPLRLIALFDVVKLPPEVGEVMRMVSSGAGATKLNETDLVVAPELAVIVAVG